MGVLKLRFGGLGHDRRILPVALVDAAYGRLAEWTLEQSFRRRGDRGHGPLSEYTVLELLGFSLSHFESQ